MENPIKEYLSYTIDSIKVFIVVSMFFALAIFSGCRVLTPPGKMEIPKEPTLWTISQVDALEYKYGRFIFYKVTPINPGQLNTRYVWIMDYSGAFQVGDRVRFEIIPADNK